MTAARVERRRSRRMAAGDAAVMPSIRIRPGYAAALVDISVDGALVETERGLSPGTRVELQMEIDARRCSVGGRVLRCAVAQLHASGVRYRSAIAFEPHLPWCPRSDGYPIPPARHGDDRDERARPTHGTF